MPLKQHPVPQHISSYEFRLIGDMTLKQFGYLSAGAILALIVYSLPLPGFFKWPLVVGSAFAGFAFAFLPFEERPLLVWITAFIKSVTAPTIFIWHKQAEPMAIFAHQPTVLPKQTPPPSKTSVETYLAGLSNTADKSEQKFLNHIQGLFQDTSKSAPLPPLSPPEPIIAEPIKRQPSPIKKLREEIRIINQPILPQEKAIFKTKPVKAETSTELPFPQPPTYPNLLVGMVLDQNEQIVEGAIIEVRNKQGLPVRAFKTNKLGQFRIATPLENGEYEMEIEKEGLKFDIIKIKAEGKIIQPIKIKAK